MTTPTLNQLVPGTLRSPEAEDGLGERQAASGVISEVPSAPIAKGAGVTTRDQRRHGSTVVLRRQPARIVDGRPEGGYADNVENRSRQAVGAMTDAG